MLSEFKNLPGIYVYKDDGNLSQRETLPGGLTVILGTAPAGPTSLYYVTSTVDAQQIYDPYNTGKGTLLKALYGALESGAKNVALMRVGATPQAIDFLNGHTIVQKSFGKSYKLHYNGTTDLIRIFDAASGTIVYDNIAGIDNGDFNVFGSKAQDINVTIGDADSGVNFESLLDFTQSAYSVAKDIAISSPSGSSFTTNSSLFKAGQIVCLKESDGSNAAHFLVSYVINNGSQYTVYLSKALTYSNGVVTESSAINLSADYTKADIKVRYIPENDGLSLTKNQLYQALARAYWELETVDADVFILSCAYFDEPNVVDNEGRFALNQAGYKAPTGDFLGKGYEFMHQGQIFYAFKNSFDTTTDKTATILPTPYELGIDGYAAKAWLKGTVTIEDALTCTTDADVALVPENITWHELNFGHQLASFLDDLSTNQTDAFGVIAMRPPANLSKSAVAQWLGRSPIHDTITGDILVSGSGVLGYKYMAGSLGVQEGLFKTTTGFVDGPKVIDRNGMPIDIGKYIDVVATPLIATTGASSSAYLSSGVEFYGGLVSGLTPNISPMNKVFKSNVKLAFPLKKLYLDALVGTKYIVFTDSPNGVKVVDAPTAALKTSDYNRRVLCRIAGGILDIIRDIADPYIGYITSGAILKNLEDEINAALYELQKQSSPWILAGKITLRQTQDMRIKGWAVAELVLVTAPELKRLTIYHMYAKNT